MIAKMRYLGIAVAAIGLILAGCSNDDGGTDPGGGSSVTVRLFAPADSTVVNERVTVAANVNGAEAEWVDFYIDDLEQPYASDSGEPYQFIWDVTGYADSSEHQLLAIARLTADRNYSSNQIMVTVNNSDARPAAVQFVGEIEQSGTMVTLQWQRSAASDFARYEIYMTSSTGETDDARLEATITSHTIDTLTLDHELDNVTRYYRIFVYDTVGLYSTSEEIAATSLNTPPASPDLTVTENLTAESIDLSWTPATEHDFDRYEVRRSTVAGVGTSGALVHSSTSAMSTNFRDLSIVPLKAYYYRLYVYDTGNLSAASEEVMVEIPSRRSLAALWTFEDTEGAKILDASGNDRDASRRNGAQVIDAIFGDGLLLDGSNDFASFPVLYTDPPDSLTVSAWAATSCDYCGCLVYHGQYGEWGLCVDPDDSISCRLRFDNAQWQSLQVPIAVDTNWHHYAMVYIKGVGVAAYLDGDSLGMMTTPDRELFDPGSDYYASLGSFGCGCSKKDYYDGKLDEVRVYLRALSATEIRLLSQQQ
jgi:hypothetical protein